MSLVDEPRGSEKALPPTEAPRPRPRRRGRRQRHEERGQLPPREPVVHVQPQRQHVLVRQGHLQHEGDVAPEEVSMSRCPLPSPVS